MKHNLTALLNAVTAAGKKLQRGTMT